MVFKEPRPRDISSETDILFTEKEIGWKSCILTALKLKIGFLSIEAACEWSIPMGTRPSLEKGEHPVGVTEQPETGSDPVRTQLFHFTLVPEHREMGHWCCLLQLSTKFKAVVLVQQNHRCSISELWAGILLVGVESCQQIASGIQCIVDCYTETFLRMSLSQKGFRLLKLSC